MNKFLRNFLEGFIGLIAIASFIYLFGCMMVELLSNLKDLFRVLINIWWVFVLFGLFYAGFERD